MPTAIISQTIRQPVIGDINGFIMLGDFTSGAGIRIQVEVSLKNDSDRSENRTISFPINASAGQLNHFQSDVVSAMSTIIADVEANLGVTFT